MDVTTISDSHRESMRAGLNEADLHPNPFRQFAIWFDEAQAAGIVQPHAMTLATATPDGRPSARVVLLKGVDAQGFIFYSNYESQKGHELAANPQAALVFHWAKLERQVRVVGRVERVSRQESEDYFQSRPLGSRLGAWASRQSRVIAGREVLVQRLRELQEEYGDGDIPLPPYWGGYRVIADQIEFWQGRPNRLHDRLRYSRRPDGTWLIERLSP
ncbi:MAG TPA: pyridoxamine 5'-phosphate oxidase [Chloroflexota bacterium]|nr:pyridoxamine 5'-phosphate oxidase [Chloroflexota bacterium]